jgi:AcrR family transcriptional regulator
VICYTISSTPLQSKERGLPSERISRGDAVERFLDATAALVCSQSPADVTLADIACRAELGPYYIYRFFGTRLDLLIEVSDVLAAQAGELLQYKISDNDLDFAQLLEFCRSVCFHRIQLLQHLTAQGVPATRFQKGNRLIFTGISQFFKNSGVPIARALSNGAVTLALVHAEISLLPTFDLEKEELNDLISLFAAM